MLSSEQEVLNKTQLNESNDTFDASQVVVISQVLPRKQGNPSNPDAAVVIDKKECYVPDPKNKYRSVKSVSSVYSMFSVCGIFTMMSVLASSSFCSIFSVNTAFSIASANSVASIASVNSVLSFGSVNCVGCVFNIPINRGALGTCDKYSFTDEDHTKELLYGRAYTTFTPASNDLSEEDLVNDCCLYTHSSEAKKHRVQGFIVNSDRTACMMFGETGDAVLGRSDVDTAQDVYKPAQLDD